MNASSLNMRQSGFGMVEVLVTLIILLVGLLGLAGLMVQSQRSEMESYQRVQALVLLQDMAGRINANRNVAQCYAFTTASLGTPFVGTPSGTSSLTLPPACAATQASDPTQFTLAQQTQFQQDTAAWNTALQGAAESSGGNATGAMIGARGCVSYDGTNLLPEIDPQSGLPTGNTLPGTGIYTLSVAWQGMGDTYANTALLCGTGQYNNAQGTGDEALRRVVSLTFRMAALTK